MILAPVVRDQKGEFRDVIERLAREGFVRARVDGEVVELADGVRVKLDPKVRHTIEAVVDRLVIDEKIRIRLSDSVETALKWGEGILITLHQLPLPESKAQGPSAFAKATADTKSKANTQAAPPRPPTLDPALIETLHSNRNFSAATGKC